MARKKSKTRTTSGKRKAVPATKSRRTSAAGMNRLAVPKTYKLFVKGVFVRSESGRYLSIENERGGFVANYACASRKDFREAVVAARGAFGPWAGRSAFNRSQILYRMAEMLEDRRGLFERNLTTLAGVTAVVAEREVSVSVDRLFWYAGWCDKFSQVLGGINPVAAPFLNFTIPEPMGVVAIFSPEHSPLLGLVSAIAPVILSGNTAVVIVDNRAPTLSVDFSEVLATSDLPAGVVNILTGLRDELLPHAASHMDVNAVAWFGGTEAQVRSVEVFAADSVKRVRVFEDPPIEKWTDNAMQSLYWIQPFVEWKTTWHPIGV